ncbi:MAG: hypothetical protein MJ252_15785 [archaeon]|nr:hypothetical protein [archaeon]
MKKDNYLKYSKKRLYSYTQPISPKYMSKTCSNFTLKKYEMYVHKQLRLKYFNDQYYYGSIVVNDIIYNERRHLVAKFKDFLIVDDLSEFLKRYYKLNESLVRLPKYFDYYETYSRIFPNYTALPESKYIYKNINKKQKMIDLLQEREELEEEEKEQKKVRHRNVDSDNDLQVFSTEVCNSIAEDSSFAYSFFGVRNDHLNDSIEEINDLIKKITNYENYYLPKKKEKISTAILKQSLLSQKNNNNGTINNIYRSININIFNGVGNIPINKDKQKKRNSKNESDILISNYFPKTNRSEFNGSKIQRKIKVNMNSIDYSKKSINQGESNFFEEGCKTERLNSKQNTGITDPFILNTNLSKNSSKNEDSKRKNFGQLFLKNSISTLKVPFKSPRSNSRNLTNNNSKGQIRSGSNSKCNNDTKNSKKNNVINFNLKQKNSPFMFLNKNFMFNYNSTYKPVSTSRGKNTSRPSTNNIKTSSSTNRIVPSSKYNTKKSLFQVNVNNKASGRNVFLLNNMLSPRYLLTGGSQTSRVRSTSKNSTNTNQSSSNFHNTKYNKPRDIKTPSINFCHNKNKSTVLNINKNLPQTKPVNKIPHQVNLNQKKNIIKGIEIKGFNKALGILGTESPRVKTAGGHKKVQSSTYRGLKYYNQNDLLE